MLFSDGRFAGGMLDRNGLRPARYLITKNDMMVVASEVGVIDFEPGDIKEKGRLQPGKILLVDTEKGEIFYDGELKKQLAEAKPYRIWLSTNRIELDELKSGRKMPHHVENYDRMLRTFGYSKEDIERLIMPMASTGAEPIHSMGNDTPLAVLSDKPQLFYNYFRQQFAQVTNPPIDPLREELVMSLTEYIGAVGMNILTPSESHCKMVRLNHPILCNTQLDILCNMDKIPVCAHYELNGEQTDDFPFPVLLQDAKPVVEYLPGWQCDISGARNWEDLPEAARSYVEYVEKAIGCHIGFVTVGAERESLIIR